MAIEISIHAPIVGCDCFNGFSVYRPIHFNPRTHRGVRRLNCLTSFYFTLFQSTHPSWGATEMCDTEKNGKVISIHAPIVGCDYNSILIEQLMGISIHAPIVGCDLLSRLIKIDCLYFNPRTHRGVRP